MCLCFLTDAGRPDCSELAAAATHDDGADTFTVHLHLQSPHSVPEKLQTDLRPALARRRRPPSPMSPLTTSQSAGAVNASHRQRRRGFASWALPRSISDGARHEPGQVWRTLRRALFNQYYSQISLWAFTRDHGWQSQHFYFAVHRREWCSSVI